VSTRFANMTGRYEQAYELDLEGIVAEECAPRKLWLAPDSGRL
jgi:hypothetical protein